MADLSKAPGGEVSIVSSAAYRRLHKEQISAYNREYQAAHREYFEEYNRTHKAEKQKSSRESHCRCLSIIRERQEYDVKP